VYGRGPSRVRTGCGGIEDSQGSARRVGGCSGCAPLYDSVDEVTYINTDLGLIHALVVCTEAMIPAGLSP